MKKFKSHKIKETINKSNEDLNLHEIKAKTGAGNGYKHSYTISLSICRELIPAPALDTKIHRCSSPLCKWHREAGHPYPWVLQGQIQKANCT